MKHLLRNNRLLLCDPAIFEAALQRLDEFQPPIVGEIEAMPMPDDGDMDCYGDPIPRMTLQNGVAIVPIKGVICENIPTLFKAFGMVDLRDVRADLMAAREMAQTIVLDIDSPGGTITGVPETADLVAEIQRSGKNIYTRTLGDCCSAAYWIAAGSTGIFAAPSAQVGSIGVYQAAVDVSGYYDQLGIAVKLFKVGKFKGAGYPGTSLTDEQSAQIQDQVDIIGKMFKSHVTAFRGVSDETMQGQVFLGAQASTNGLIDGTPADLASLGVDFV